MPNLVFENLNSLLYRTVSQHIHWIDYPMDMLRYGLVPEIPTIISVISVICVSHVVETKVYETAIVAAIVARARCGVGALK